MSLYLWVILSAFVGPLVLSFDKKVHFYTYWKSIFLGIIMLVEDLVPKVTGTKRFL
jgi:hypothetical protein